MYFEFVGWNPSHPKITETAVLELAGKMHQIVRKTKSQEVFKQARKVIDSVLEHIKTAPEYIDEREDLKTEMKNQGIQSLGGRSVSCYFCGRARGGYSRSHSF